MSQGKINFPGFESVEESSSSNVVIETVAVVRAKRSIRSRWEGREMVPAGTIIDDLLRSFAAGSNIPLDLPFWTLIHACSAKLCQMNVSLSLGNGSVVHPDIWTVVLASSGAGKTYTANHVLKNVAPDVPIVKSDAVSSAKLFEDIAETPRGLFFSDEFYQLFRQIETVNGPMADARRMFLKLYDGGDVSKSSKKDGTIVIENPRLSLLGLTVTDTFVEGVSAESLTDGFLQRFGICIAKPDPFRPGSEFPIWSVEAKLFDHWQRIFSIIQESKQYSLGSEALDEYKNFFKAHFENLPESFYRRVLWRTLKLSMVYHVLIGLGDEEKIGNVAMGYAIRATERSIVDSAELLLRSKGGELGKAVESAQRAYDKAMIQGGRFTVRDLLRAVPRLSNATTARFVYELIEKIPPPSAIAPD